MNYSRVEFSFFNLPAIGQKSAFLCIHLILKSSMVFNAISDTIIRKQEVSFTSCFLYTLKQSAVFGFAEKGLKAGDQTKRLSYSSPADSRYACITDSLGYIINHAFSLSCASIK